MVPVAGVSYRAEALPADEPPRPRLAKRLRQFFLDELQLTPDVSTLVGRGGEMVTRLSGGLAEWARRSSLWL